MTIVFYAKVKKRLDKASSKSSNGDRDKFDRDGNRDKFGTIMTMWHFSILN